MFNVKTFELRDKATFIPIICIELFADYTLSPSDLFLVRRAGYGSTHCILLTRMDGGGRAQYNPYDWEGRTFPVAHKFINENWETLVSGQVIDVEFILGETKEPKISEKETFYG